MAVDAIPSKDVSEAPEQEDRKEQEVQKFNDRRSEMMEIIARQANQQFEKDEEVTPEPPPEDSTSGSPTPPEPPAVASDTPNALDAPAAQPPPTEKMVTVIVNGKAQEVPESQVLEHGKRSYQKELAADQYLEEAKRLKREVEQLKQEMLSEKKSDAPIAPPPQDPMANVSAKVPAWMTAIRYGTEEEANAAFIEALTATHPKPEPTLEPNKVMRMVDERLQSSSIVTRFDHTPPDKGGFSDISKEPYLRQLAAQEVDRLVAEGNHPLDWATYEKAGTKIRAWRDSLIPKQEVVPEPPPPAPNSFEEKAEKKKTIDSVPKASARTITGDKAPEKEQTPADVIAEMQKHRARIQTGVR